MSAGSIIQLNGQYNCQTAKDQNLIGEKISEVRKQHNMSLSAFRSRLSMYGVNISQSGINKWEMGHSIPNAYQLYAICCALDTTASALLSSKSAPVLNEVGMRKLEEYKSDLIATGLYLPAEHYKPAKRMITMPICELRVSAGPGNLLDDGPFDEMSFEEDSVPDGADFGVFVSGDSMEPRFHDGQIAWIRRCNVLQPGTIGVFAYDGCGYIKEYHEVEPDKSERGEYTGSDGVVHKQPVLVSLNNKYEPIKVKRTSPFYIIGEVLS